MFLRRGAANYHIRQIFLFLLQGLGTEFAKGNSTRYIFSHQP